LHRYFWYKEKYFFAKRWELPIEFSNGNSKLLILWSLNLNGAFIFCQHLDGQVLKVPRKVKDGKWWLQISLKVYWIRKSFHSLQSPYHNELSEKLYYICETRKEIKLECHKCNSSTYRWYSKHWKITLMVKKICEYSGSKTILNNWKPYFSMLNNVTILIPQPAMECESILVKLAA